LASKEADAQYHVPPINGARTNGIAQFTAKRNCKNRPYFSYSDVNSKVCTDDIALQAMLFDPVVDNWGVAEGVARPKLSALGTDFSNYFLERISGRTF